MVAPSKQPASSPLTVTADVDDFARLLSRTSVVDAKLRTGLRRNIRNVAKTVASDVKNEVLKPPLRAGRNPRHTGLRQGIAAGVGVSILTGNSRAGVQITSRGFLARAYDKPQGWRHPTYGTDAWVTQRGRPYFRDRIPAHRDEMAKAVQAALAEAVASLEGK